MSNSETKNTEYIYGPVHSWRLGNSLGIDILGEISTCSFNCTYCQLGRIQKITTEIKTYVPTEKIIQDLIDQEATKRFVYEDLDVITFAGSGEPTLAENLGEAIDEIRTLYALRSKQVPISILTNATTLNDAEVRQKIKKANLISLKLDAVNDQMLKAINQPAPGISLASIIEGIKRLKSEIDPSQTTLQLQIMIMPKTLRHHEESVVASAKTDDVVIQTTQDSENSGLLRGACSERSVAARNDALEDLAKLIAELQINKIQINTPTRPKPLYHSDEYWIETRGNHYVPNTADADLRVESKPDYIEFKELPVISREEALAIETYLRNTLNDKLPGLEIINVYKH